MDVRGCRLCRCPFSFSFILYRLTIAEAVLKLYGMITAKLFNC
nr:MAG TPA: TERATOCARCINOMA-DERIVED GROWTH FACTOR/GROWTH FACTOR, GROWTH FACTOR, EGF-CFC [Caudoviricetes sp.]